MKTFSLTGVIITVFLFVAFAAEKLIDGKSVGIKECIASLIGGVVGAILAVFISRRFASNPAMSKSKKEE